MGQRKPGPGSRDHKARFHFPPTPLYILFLAPFTPISSRLSPPSVLPPSSRLQLGFLASALPRHRRPRPPCRSKVCLLAPHRSTRDRSRRRLSPTDLVPWGPDVCSGFGAVLQEGRPSRSSRPRSPRRTTTRYVVVLPLLALPIRRSDERSAPVILGLEMFRLIWCRSVCAWLLIADDSLGGYEFGGLLCLCACCAALESCQNQGFVNVWS